MAGEDEIDLGALQTLERVAGVVDDVPLAAGSGDRKQMVVQNEDPQVRRSRECLLDQAVAAASDLAVVEVGLGRVDRDDRRRPDVEHRVPLAEEILEVDVADVARVVVARDHDHRLAVDAVQVVARERVLVFETVRGEVARDHDESGSISFTSAIARSRCCGRKNCIPQCKSDSCTIRNIGGRLDSSRRLCYSLAGSSTSGVYFVPNVSGVRPRSYLDFRWSFSSRSFRRIAVPSRRVSRAPQSSSARRCSTITTSRGNTSPGPSCWRRTRRGA